MTPEALPRPFPQRVYPGWWIVAAGFVNAALVIGSTIYLFGLLVAPVSREFGLSRADANNGYIAFMLGMTLWAPLGGWLVDRLPVRLVMPVGAVLMLTGFLTIANTNSLWLIAAMIFGPLAMGGTLAGLLSSTTVVTRWFRRRRGRALGVMAMNSSVAGLVVSPAAAALIETFGWRTALLIMGSALTAVVVVLGSLVMRDRPSEDQLEAAGETQPEESRKPNVEDRTWTLGELARNRNFHLIMFGIGLLLASDQVILASKVPYMLDRGVDLKAASLIVACQSASALCGKLVVGYLADRFDLRRLFAVVVLFHLILLALYVVWPGYWVMVAACSIIGVAIGGVYPVKLLLTASVFGSRSFGLAWGAMHLGTQPLSIIALRYTGVMYDRTGAYTLAFVTLMACVVLSVVLISFVDLKGGTIARRRAAEPQAQSV
ncbi:MFS transporter [Phenylobacterium sp.]|jgi:MFS family permease|uniref:MFS transporter n=1 Tax=Phenylobacterium sp. TaxID=1871053 RepID=UPI002F3FDCB3